VILASLSDPRAFAELFDRHAQRTVRFLERQVGPDLAQDLLSEVFVIAFERRNTFDVEREHALPWLYGIAANLVRRHARSRARHVRAVAQLTASLGRDGSSESDDVAARIDATRLLPDVADALLGLAERDLDVVLLTAFEGLTPKEVAGVLGVPAGTVRSRLNRARRLIRERVPGIGQYEDEADRGGDA